MHLSLTSRNLLAWTYICAAELATWGVGPNINELSFSLSQAYQGTPEQSVCMHAPIIEFIAHYCTQPSQLQTCNTLYPMSWPAHPPVWVQDYMYIV